MEALVILAYLIGTAALIMALGFFFRSVDGSGVRSPRGEIDTKPPVGLYTPDRTIREPQTWNYEKKTTVTTYAPKGKKPLPDDPDLSTKLH